MVIGIRNIEKALGSNIKTASKSEKINMDIVRKSIVANITIQKGSVLTDKNLAIMRPGNGISPMKWDDIIGSIAKKNYNKGDLI